MDGHGHGRTDGRPWTAIKINKASAGPLAPKIGILTILMSPITLQLFFMPSDYGVVLLWYVEVLRHSFLMGCGLPVHGL